MNDTLAYALLLLIVAVVWLVPCAVVFARPRRLRAVILVGAVLAAVFSLVYGSSLDSPDLDGDDEYFLALIVAGLLLFAWCLGAVVGLGPAVWHSRLRTHRDETRAR
jgi:hypothetical protein